VVAGGASPVENKTPVALWRRRMKEQKVNNNRAAGFTAMLWRSVDKCVAPVAYQWWSVASALGLRR
jgi:hypothetical protein